MCNTYNESGSRPAVLTKFMTYTPEIFFNFQGKHLWLRCIGATSIGELVYSSIFDGIFFAHSLSMTKIMDIIINNYSFKFMFEVFTLPITYMLVNILDKCECKTTIKYINFEPNI